MSVQVPVIWMIIASTRSHYWFLLHRYFSIFNVILFLNLLYQWLWNKICIVKGVTVFHNCDRSQNSNPNNYQKQLFLQTKLILPCLNLKRPSPIMLVFVHLFAFIMHEWMSVLAGGLLFVGFGCSKKTARWGANRSGKCILQHSVDLSHIWQYTYSPLIFRKKWSATIVEYSLWVMEFHN